MNHCCDLKKVLSADFSSQKVPGSDVTLLANAESAASFTKFRTLPYPSIPGTPDSSQAGSKVALPISSLPCRESQREDQLMQAAV